MPVTPEAASGVAGGIVVTIVGWFLSRTNGAAERRAKEIRGVAVAVCAEIEKEAKVEVRLTKLETKLEEILPRFEKKLDKVADTIEDLARASGILKRERD